MRTAFFVFLGGGLGSVGRYFVGVGAGRLIGTGFPWGTLIVNIVGCFVMGLLIETMALRWSVHQDARAFMAIGILGGFTTFSAFSADFALLTERKQYLVAASYLSASVFFSLLAVFAGMVLVRSLPE